MITRATIVGFLAGIVVGFGIAWLTGFATLPGRYTFKTDDLVTTRHDTATGDIVVFVVDSQEKKVRRLNLSGMAEENR